MPSASKQIRNFREFTKTYPVEASAAEKILELIPSWHADLMKIRQELKEKFTLIAQQTGYADLVEKLRQILSPELGENDIRKIFQEAVLLQLILPEEQLKKIRQHSFTALLLDFTAKEGLIQLESQLQKTFQQTTQKITLLFPAEHLILFWQTQLSEQSKELSLLLHQQAIQQATYLQQYLMKRQLATSPTDAQTKILWLQPLEHLWQEALLAQAETSAAMKAQAQQFISLYNSFLPFAFQLLQNDEDSISQPYWLDPFQVNIQGMQTQLFSDLPAHLEYIDQLSNMRFTSILLDFRSESKAYTYYRKQLRQQEQQLSEHFSLGGNDVFQAGYRESLLYWAEQRLQEKSILLLIKPRHFLTSTADVALRRYMSENYRQIFVLDYFMAGDQQTEGVCVIYLIGGMTNQKRLAGIQYAAMPYEADQTSASLSFEEILWSNISPERQNYWIGLPESDFFDFLPVGKTKNAFFQKAVPGFESLMPDWQMDHDPQILQKKIKFLIKEYQKALTTKGHQLNPEIRWHPVVKQMAEQGISLAFNSELIQKVMVRPFVSSYLYAAEKLMRSPFGPATAIRLKRGTAEAVATTISFLQDIPNNWQIFPLTSEQAERVPNISDEALQRFRDFYREKAKNLNSNFIVFPPENITQTLDRIASVSQDLPVIRKYPEQIIKMLEDARNFTSDVELLAPPYEKIEEFRQKVHRLERDAIERKVIYQRVKNYIEELKEQLNALTREYDQAQQDLQAVNKENLFYYLYAVLHDPGYTVRYREHLRWELPRVPLYPHFRKWVNWGKTLFELHSLQKQADPVNLQVQQEVLDKPVSRFSYQLNRQEASLVLKEGQQFIRITDLPTETWSYRVESLTPLEHLLQHLSDKAKQNKVLPRKFTVEVLTEPDELIEKIAHYCGISMQTASIISEIREARKS